jgi:hypothetical protein
VTNILYMDFVARNDTGRFQIFCRTHVLTRAELLFRVPFRQIQIRSRFGRLRNSDGD